MCIRDRGEGGRDGALAGEQPEQEVGRAEADFLERLADNCERGTGDPRKIEIVKADEGKLLGNPHAALVEGDQRADVYKRQHRDCAAREKGTGRRRGSAPDPATFYKRWTKISIGSAVKRKAR